MDWESGVELGRHLERMRHLESDVDHLKTDVGEIQALIKRVSILIALWGGAIVLALTSERGPEALATLVKTLLAKS